MKENFAAIRAIIDRIEREKSWCFAPSRNVTYQGYRTATKVSFSCSNMNAWKEPEQGNGTFVAV